MTSNTWSILLSLTPTVSLLVFFLGAYGIFRILFRSGNYPHFKEVEERPASKLLSRNLRTFLFWFLQPIENFLVRNRVSPNGITLFSVILAGAAGFLLATGEFAAGGWLYIFSGICDVFDGRVARKTNHVTPGGCILDSVADRYSEFFIFAGLAWFYRDTWILALVLAALFGSMLVSYVRSKAESIGIPCSVGRFQRAERLFYIGSGAALSPILTSIIEADREPTHWLAVATLGFIAFGANGTAGYRILYAVREATRLAEQENASSSTVPFPKPKENQSLTKTDNSPNPTHLPGRVEGGRT